ncbi:hypothetical protein ACFLY5_00455, partial [Patescibacteria group bacterium]
VKTKRIFSRSPEFERGGGGAIEKISDIEENKLKLEISTELSIHKKENDIEMDLSGVAKDLSKRDLAVYKQFKSGALSFQDMQNYKMEIMDASLEDENNPRNIFYSWLSMEWQKNPENFKE